MAEQGRTPTKTEKLRLSLEQAGENGMTTVALSKLLYGDDDYTAQGKTKNLIQNLRRRGYKIRMVRDEGFQAGRYVLESGQGLSDRQAFDRIMEIVTAKLAELDVSLPAETLAKILVEQLTTPAMKSKVAKALEPFVQSWLDGSGLS